MSPRPLRHLVPLLPLLAACGTATPAPGPDASAPRDASPTEVATDAADVRDAADETADDDVPPCAVRPDAAGVACVRQVRGRAVDFDGAALGGHVITYCGPTCYAVTAAADGTFSVEVNDFVAPRDYTLQVHGRPDHASLWVAGVDPVNEVVTFADPIAVPRYQDVGAEITAGAAGGSFAAGDVTLLVPAGARVEFDVEDFELGALGRTLRAVRVEAARAPTFARDAGLVAVWAMAPFNLLSDRPLGVRVANRAALPAGSAVDFVVMGNEIVSPPITGGRPVVAATGRVSADGATIATDPGAGISYVTWIGVRPRR
jgi:hypothetical protein